MAKKAAPRPATDPNAPATQAPELVAMVIGELVPNPKNARTHPEDQLLRLEASLRTNGQTRPVLVRRENKMLIAGHGVTEAAKRIGMQTLQVLLLDVPQDVADRIMLGDNRLGDLSETDQAKVAELLRGIPDFDWPAAGYSDTEVNKLYAKLEEDDLQIHDIATSDVRDDFWISLRGPMRMQAEVLQRVKELLKEVPQILIQIGITEDVTF